jgi:hypothetical protein
MHIQTSQKVDAMLGTIVAILIIWFLLSIPVSLLVARVLAAKEHVYDREVRRIEARTGQRLPDTPAFSSESPQVIV